MKKALLITSVASMIEQFNIPNIALLNNMGYEVHVACNFKKGSTCNKENIDYLRKTLKDMNVKYFDIDFSRSMLDIKENIKAYKQIKDILVREKYTFIHCQSPIGGVCGRLAAHKTKTSVIYTAHGFHFYSGCPWKNWILYYPIEYFLSYFTDVLITINIEDYNRAKKFKAKSLKYVPGVGIDTTHYTDSFNEINKKRKSIGVKEGDILVLSVGELNKNKNHKTIIKAISTLKQPNIKYVICGKGILKDRLIDLAEEENIGSQLILLGYRNDIIQIYNCADIFAFPSYREGLSVALMEAMAAKLPVVCSEIRGNTDLIDNNLGGYTVNPDDFRSFATKIQALIKDESMRNEFGKYNGEKIKKFDLAVVKEDMKEIYTAMGED